MIAPFTLVWGDDTHKQRQFEEAFAAKVVDPGFAAMNQQVLDGDADASMVAAAAATPPFGPGGRLVIVRGCRYFSGRKKEEDEAESTEEADSGPLSALFEKGLPSGCHLLLIVEGKLDKRKALTKVAVAKATVREFSLTDTPWDTSGSAAWISDQVQRLGVGIHPDAIKALIAVTSGDRWRLESELAKLALYTDGKPITLEAVLTMSPPSEADVFAVLKTLAQRDALGTLRGFQRLLTLDKPERVLATLSTMMRGWHKAKHLSERGLDPMAIAQELGWKPARVSNQLAELKRWNSLQLQKALVALLEAEIAIKTGRGRDHLTLTFEAMVARMLAA